LKTFFLSPKTTILSNNLPVEHDLSSGSVLHEVPKVEARLYYAGIRPKGRGPKLIYRTSSDIFEEPSGFEAYARLMKVITVPENHEFGKNGLWDRVRDKVCGFLFYAAIFDQHFIPRLSDSLIKGVSKRHLSISFDSPGSTRSR